MDQPRAYEAYDLTERAGLGAAAKQITEAGVFNLAMVETRLRIVEKWEEAETPEEREAAHATLRALNGVFTTLCEIQADGEHAEALIEARADKEE